MFNSGNKCRCLCLLSHLDWSGLSVKLMIVLSESPEWCFQCIDMYVFYCVSQNGGFVGHRTSASLHLPSEGKSSVIVPHCTFPQNVRNVFSSMFTNKVKSSRQYTHTSVLKSNRISFGISTLGSVTIVPWTWFLFGLAMKMVWKRWAAKGPKRGLVVQPITPAPSIVHISIGYNVFCSGRWPWNQSSTRAFSHSRSRKSCQDQIRQSHFLDDTTNSCENGNASSWNRD